MRAVRVGLLDSGCAGALAGASFADGPQGEALCGPAGPDRVGHGSAIAALIRAACPSARLLNAQIFAGGAVTSPVAAAAGLDWLVAEGAEIVCMAFGLRPDRAILRAACAAAGRAGVVLVAAAPARGDPVHPAAYPEAIAVSGDARCAPGVVSALHTGTVDYGACPRPPEGHAGGGASFATGHLCGVLAAAMAAGQVNGVAAARAHLDAVARFHGPERRSAAG